jgi:hypothetical protein
MPWIQTPAGAQYVSDEKPAQNATKADWVEYAVSQGADRAEAEDATKAELVEKHG